MSHFARGICLAEVKHKISQLNGVGINFHSQLFYKACSDCRYVAIEVFNMY